MKTIKLRQADDADRDFLREVYRSTRADEVAGFGWDEAQQAAFLDMQFSAQQQSYELQYPSADNSVIMFGVEPAGRLIVDRGPAEILLVDIAVLPHFRKNGIAATLIRELQAEAASAGKAVTLCVDMANAPALALYTKLGFAVTGESQFDYSMEWKA